MKIVKVVVRSAGILLLILIGLLIAAAGYARLPRSVRAGINRAWSRTLLVLCGIRLQVSGAEVTQGRVLLVANHVSWVDIFAMNSVRATAFIAKSEIRRWPLVGWLAVAAGTVFIERGDRRAVNAVGQSMRARFDAGDAVGLFPEGTTSDGSALLPFHAGLFESVRYLSIPIQPLALRFMQHGKPSPIAAFVGEETLLANVWRVLGAQGLGVELKFMPVLTFHSQQGQEPPTRQEIARMARTAIASGLNPHRMPD